MDMTKVELEIPVAMKPYIKLTKKEMGLKQCALLLYPYISDEIISHGKAAEILGIRKLDLIDLYGEMGLAYFDMTMDELDEDIVTFQPLRGVTA